MALPARRSSRLRRARSRGRQRERLGVRAGSKLEKNVGTPSQLAVHPRGRSRRRRPGTSRAEPRAMRRAAAQQIARHVIEDVEGDDASSDPGRSRRREVGVQEVAAPARAPCPASWRSRGRRRSAEARASSSVSRVPPPSRARGRAHRRRRAREPRTTRGGGRPDRRGPRLPGVDHRVVAGADEFRPWVAHFDLHVEERRRSLRALERLEVRVRRSRSRSRGGRRRAAPGRIVSPTCR